MFPFCMQREKLLGLGFFFRYKMLVHHFEMSGFAVCAAACTAWFDSVPVLQKSEDTHKCHQQQDLQGPLV